MSNLIILATVIFSLVTINAGAVDFKKAVEPYEWSFPRDHGSHNEFQTEWWYFTGHLSAENHTYGFELTTFRVSSGLRKTKSNWSSDQIFLSHFTITDEKESKFYHYELANRNTFGIAGASEDNLDVWNGSYRIKLKNNKFIINASSPEAGLSLELTMLSKIVLNGVNGLSQKGEQVGNASYYYSIPRLQGTGKLKLKDQEINIKNASVWMDREFFTIEESGNNGWDWFSIQFDDNSNLMIYQIRDKNDNPTSFSSGTYVDKNGKKFILGHDDFILTPLDDWTSRMTDKQYPVSWNIKIPVHGIDIKVNPTMNNQELVLEEVLDMTYWEGRCLVTGSHSGRAYMELVGY